MSAPMEDIRARFAIVDNEIALPLEDMQRSLTELSALPENSRRRVATELLAFAVEVQMRFDAPSPMLLAQLYVLSAAALRDGEAVREAFDEAGIDTHACAALIGSERGLLPRPEGSVSSASSVFSVFVKSKKR